MMAVGRPIGDEPLRIVGLPIAGRPSWRIVTKRDTDTLRVYVAPGQVGIRADLLTTSASAQMITKRCTAAGLPGLHPRQWRHTFAHRYPTDGGQEGDLQRLAGGRSPLMLRRYGASIADERARRAYRSPADRL